MPQKTCACIPSELVLVPNLIAISNSSSYFCRSFASNSLLNSNSCCGCLSSFILMCFNQILDHIGLGLCFHGNSLPRLRLIATNWNYSKPEFPPTCYSNQRELLLWIVRHCFLFLFQKSLFFWVRLPNVDSNFLRIS